MEITDYTTIETLLFGWKTEKKESLALIETLLNLSDHPHKAFPAVHIAGTNGKGQVTAKIAKGLELGGYKVGRFISPHLFSMRERITINGVPISEEKVVEYFHKLQTLMKKLSVQPSFFEALTWMAFCYFKEEKVDVAVIEAGLGGQYDTTNVLKPLLSVITSIGFDHKEILGETLEEIATQKAGIIKTKVPCILGPTCTAPIFFQRGKELNAPILLIEKRLPLYEQENVMLAERSLELLRDHFSLSKEAIEEGLKANLSCRFERRGNLIFDVAHNPPAFARLKEALEHTYPGKTFRFLIGMSRTKEIASALIHITSLAHFVHFVPTTHSECATPQELGKMWESMSQIPYSAEAELEKGKSGAINALKEGEILVICGSFYLLGISFVEPRLMEIH